MTLHPELLAARIAPSTSGFRGMVAAHGIDGNGQHVHWRSRHLFLLDFDDFAAFILAAMRADAVRQLRLVAVGALRKPGCFSASCARRLPVRAAEWLV